MALPFRLSLVDDQSRAGSEIFSRSCSSRPAARFAAVRLCASRDMAVPQMLALVACCGWSSRGLWRSPTSSRAGAHPRVHSGSAALLMSTNDDINPRHITQWIKNADSVAELLNLHRQYGDRYNHIHISATWMGVGKMLSAASKASEGRGYTRYRSVPQHLVRGLKPLQRRSAELALSGELGAREVANICYGIARSRIPDGPARTGLLNVHSACVALLAWCLTHAWVHWNA